MITGQANAGFVATDGHVRQLTILEHLRQIVFTNQPKTFEHPVLGVLTVGPSKARELAKLTNDELIRVKRSMFE